MTAMQSRLRFEAPHQFDRRTLLRQAAGGAAAAVLSAVVTPSLRACASPAPAERCAAFKRQLRGPVLSIPTPFTADLSIDYPGVERMIEQSIPYGIRIFALTAGNSQYAALKHEEILELTRVMIASAKGKGLTIAATGEWDAKQAIEYAHAAEDAGADAVQVMRRIDAKDDEVVEFFQTVAGATSLPIVLHGNFPPALLEKLSSIEQVVAMKQDVGLEYYIDVQRKFGERYAIFHGGAEYAYLVGYPYGSPASYTTLGTFAPQLTKQFWDAINHDDIRGAYRFVLRYEHPFFDRWSHEFWRASLEHFGVAARYMRPPNTSFTSEQMKDVAKFYKDLGLS